MASLNGRFSAPGAPRLDAESFSIICRVFPHAAIIAVASGTTEFHIINSDTARFECTYGRGCDGHCCREGRPLLYAEEIEKLEASRGTWLPLLRPEARRTVARRGFFTNRARYGQRVARNSSGWCVFFHAGCVLHRLGPDPFGLKPAVCALFPIQQDAKNRWFIRQKGFNGEKWDLRCLNPESTSTPARESLTHEIALARRFHTEEHPAA